LILLDSPLNKAGMLQVYIRSQKGVLIEVNPQIRIPRTYKRFAGLMVHLLHKLSVSAADSPAKLMKVIKNPITDHLPAGCRKISTSVKGRLIAVNSFVPALPMDPPTVFVFGTMAHGSVEEVVDWTEECVGLSEYPLSGAAALARLCGAYENHLGIL
jgi:rRNA small subunit pseudouridine methyltransferase Nep1